MTDDPWSAELPIIVYGKQMRAIILLGLLFTSCAAGAAGLPIDLDWVKSRNALPIPATEPVHVIIVLPVPRLYTNVPGNATGHAYTMGGPIAGGIAGIVDAQVRKVQAPFVERLNSTIDTAAWATKIETAFRNHVGADVLSGVASLEVRTSMPTVGPATANRRTLALFMRTHLDAGHVNLDQQLVARLGREADVFAVPGKQDFLFAQRMVVRHPGRTEVFGNSVGERSSHWTSIQPAVLGATLDKGHEELMRMLAYELNQRPQFGRRTGKQVPLDLTYGVTEIEDGSRRWLRGRNTQLYSLPN